MFLFDCVSCVYIDMYLGVCACMYVCMSVRVCLCVGPFVCECVYVCMVVLARYTHTYKSIYLPTHDYIPTVPIHACLHVYTQYTNTTNAHTHTPHTHTHKTTLKSQVHKHTHTLTHTRTHTMHKSQVSYYSVRGTFRGYSVWWMQMAMGASAWGKWKPRVRW